MGKIIEIFSLLGVKKVTIAWVSLMILTGTTASSITIFMLDFNKSLNRLEELSQKIDNINKKLSVYVDETDDRVERVEKAVVDISMLHEKQDKDYYDFTVQSILNANMMTLLYDQKILRLQELHNYYLPTKNSNSFTLREN